MKNMVYKRLLVKLSGEQLAGGTGSGIEKETVMRIADELKAAHGTGAEIVVMVGGGNYVRGAQMLDKGIKHVTADYMGMLATMINGLAITDIFNDAGGLPTHVLSSVKADQVADQYTPRRALHHLSKGRVVVIAGGTAQPYLTTDTAAVSLALELGCDVVCKLTKVAGVYDKDPMQFPDAQLFEHLTFQEAVEGEHIQVMDKAALGLALEFKKPIMVFGLEQAGSLAKVASGEQVGTLIN